jgi:hypothetical protein
LEDGSGRQFVLEPFEKLSVIWSHGIWDKYTGGEFQDTPLPRGILEDFYTGAHPYAPFTIGQLSEAT